MDRFTLGLDQIELPDDADIYFCPNSFSKPERKKQYVMDSCLLYADLDQVNPKGIKRDLRPDFAWESSPGRYQGIWLMLDRAAIEMGVSLPLWLSPESHGKINKKLTYMLGADRSGWDATQVLRVPGTTNYKYPDEPKVTLMWEYYRGHDYRTDKWKDVRKFKQPKVKRTQNSKLPVGVQQRLTATSATGDRSKVLWRLEMSLLEAGYSPDQVFWTVRNTVWNKFEGRDAALRAEIDRAAAHLRDQAAA